MPQEERKVRCRTYHPAEIFDKYIEKLMHSCKFVWGRDKIKTDWVLYAHQFLHSFFIIHLKQIVFIQLLVSFYEIAHILTAAFGHYGLGPVADHLKSELDDP
ncbi:hypothetical protein HUJ04_006855 [Dendroctonus ponderosae]|nr:hypothetical protein HUJ04_006855 [Dendroctonus ponderosae]